MSYTSSTASQTFGYDAVGNRTSFGDGTNNDSYSYDTASNRLTAIAGGHTKNYNYAANGNITDDGSHTYIYDARNRLVSVDYGTTYILNGLGQRIEKISGTTLNYAAGDANGDGAFTSADATTIVNQILQLATASGNPDCNQDGQVNVQDLACLNIRIASGSSPVSGGTVVFVYDEQGQLIGEYDQTGAAIEETVYLANQPVAVLKQGNVYYIHTDQLNTPRVISDNTDKVVWRWDSDPFGTTAANDDPDQDGVKFSYNLRFPGQYFDAESNLNYNYYRDYDPATGRYIESDPSGLAGGLNTYLYANANLLTYIDPDGLWAFGDPLPQEVVDFSAGLGDALSFNITNWIRNQMGTNDVVNKCSSSYGAGEWTGVGVDSLIAVGGLARAGFRAELGNWKQGGEWFFPEGTRGPHFHIGSGAGLQAHHLPWQAGNWARKLNYPRQSRGLIKVSASKAPIKS